MSGNTRTAREQFRAFSARPGMFVVDAYDDVASFIAGMDFAHGHDLLDGFDDWIQVKLGAKSPMVWSAYIKQQFEHLPDQQRRIFGDDCKRFLFSQIEQFFAENDNQATAKN